MKKYSFLITLSVLSTFLAGCTKVQHLDQLLTLKALSDEQAAMSKEVEAANKNFNEMAAAVQSGAISQYKTQRSVRRKFGEPILIDQEQKEGDVVEVWLYRYATQFFGSDKVYLYFDTQGKLKEWKFLKAKEAEDEQIRQETPG